MFSQSATAQEKDFIVKGFHLDLRIQAMKMDALKTFAKKLSEQGINTLVMEWEATYPFEKHPLIPNKYAYTKEEIKSFIKYCDDIGIDVIPLQQSFGHVEYILRRGIKICGKIKKIIHRFVLWKKRVIKNCSLIY